MSLRKVTSLCSNLASVTDLKRIETRHTHTHAVISEAIKPSQLVGHAAQFKFESKVEPLPVIWQSLQRLFQKVIKGLEGKINCQALGAALLLCLCWSPGLMSKHKHMVFPNQQQLLPAATGLLEENMLPLLQY